MMPVDSQEVKDITEKETKKVFVKGSRPHVRNQQVKEPVKEKRKMQTDGGYMYA